MSRTLNDHTTGSEKSFEDYFLTTEMSEPRFQRFIKETERIYGDSPYYFNQLAYTVDAIEKELLKQVRVLLTKTLEAEIEMCQKPSNVPDVAKKYAEQRFKRFKAKVLGDMG